MDGYNNVYRLAVLKKKSALCLSKSAFPQEIKQSHQRVRPELLQK